MLNLSGEIVITFNVGLMYYAISGKARAIVLAHFNAPSL